MDPTLFQRWFHNGLCSASASRVLPAVHLAFLPGVVLSYQVQNSNLLIYVKIFKIFKAFFLGFLL